MTQPMETTTRLETIWYASDGTDSNDWEADAVFADENHAKAYAFGAWVLAETYKCEDDHTEQPSADCDRCKGRAALRERLEWRQPSWATWWELWHRGADAGGKDLHTGVTVAPSKLHWPTVTPVDPPTSENPSPVGATSTAVDPTREGAEYDLPATPEQLAEVWSSATPTDLEETAEAAARRFASQLERLRTGLSALGFAPLPSALAVEGAWVELALEAAEALAREQDRANMMAMQRGKILGLCDRAEEVVPWKVDGPPKAWTLDPAAVREALTAPEMPANEALELASQLVTYANRNAPPRGPLSREEEILHALAWQGRQAFAANPGEVDAEDRAMLQLLEYARDDYESAWAVAFLELVLAPVDGTDEERELDEAIAEWRKATQAAAEEIVELPTAPGEPGGDRG